MIGLPPLEALTSGHGGQVLKVGIVGAGIGGLIAAIALAASGHDVEVFEKSHFAKEAGAAIMAPPNFSRILRYYGFDFEKARATEAGDILYYRGGSGEPSFVAPVADYEKNFLAPWLYFHRVDLHNELQSMAFGDTGANTPRKKVSMKLGVAVNDVGLDGIMTLQDGTVLQKDLVVVADGIRSAFTSKIIGEPVESEHSMSMLRFLITTDELPDNPNVKQVLKEGLTKLRIVLGAEKSMATYGCRKGELQNVGILFQPSLEKNDKGEPANPSELLDKVTEDFHPAFREMCIGASGIGTWKLYKRTPLPRFARGKVVVIGDAAHPMAPVRSQGASMAVEDSAALGVLFIRMNSPAEVEERLALYNRLRVRRVASVQTISTMHEWAPSKLSAKEATYFDGKIPETSADIDDLILRNSVMEDAWRLLNESNTL